MAADFALLLPSPSDQGALGLEDGFTIFVHPDAWPRLWKALDAGEPFSLAPTDGRMPVDFVQVPDAD